MQLNLKASNLELTPELKDYIQLKMDMLDKYLSKFKVIKARAEIEKTTNHHLKGEIYRFELNLTIGGDLLRVEKTEKDAFKAIDKVKDHLDLVIKKYKDKKIGRKKKKQKLSLIE